MANIIDKRMLELCSKVVRKRPRAVLDKILEVGFITTEDLQDMGYDHPPRAARDVRENGIPLETFKAISKKTGRAIAAYRLGSIDDIKAGRIGGRVAFSKQFKDELIAKYGSRDLISGALLESRYLQIDHRIPYEVAGDIDSVNRKLDDYMLIDASNQRAKSWTCESCDNWTKKRDVGICSKCYWAYPEDYSHIAMSEIRMASIVWKDQEVKIYNKLLSAAEKKQ